MTYDKDGEVFFVREKAHLYQDDQWIPVEDFPGWDDEEYWDARASQARGEAGCD